MKKNLDPNRTPWTNCYKGACSLQQRLAQVVANLAILRMIHEGKKLSRNKGGSNDL